MAGTWGSRESEADYRWDLYFHGQGMLTVNSGVGLTPMASGSVIILQ